MNKVYILREDNYHEWAYENGATNIIAVSNSIDKILEEFQASYVRELLTDEDRIVGDKDMTCYDTTQNAKQSLEMGLAYYCDIYTNNENYMSGYNHGTFVIEAKEVL